MTENNQSRGPRDDEYAGDVWFFSDTYRFYIDGLKALRDHFKDYERIVNSFQIQESSFVFLLERINRIIDWAEKKLNAIKDERSPIYERNVSYGNLRLLKAGGLFRVHLLEQLRNRELEENPNLPSSLLSAINEKIAQLRDRLEQGVLNGLSPAHIFFEATKKSLFKPVEPIEESGIPRTDKPSSVPPYLEEMPVLDDTLRKRCLQLIASFDASLDPIKNGENETSLDTVVREMSVILEDRIRKLAGLEGENLVGVALMNRAFGVNNPLLRFSDQRNIQESACSLFRGYSGFVRNEVMHGLVPSFTRERVFQLLGLVDYLLFLLTQADYSGTVTSQEE